MVFSNEDYVKEFMYRTKYNYYKMCCLTDSERNEVEGKIEKWRNYEVPEIGEEEEAPDAYVEEYEIILERDAKSRKCLEDLKLQKPQYFNNGRINYFEVTQLVNSLVGLLILPQQRYFKKINNDILKECRIFNTLTKSMCKNLDQIIDSTENTFLNMPTYINTFNKDSPTDVLRSMRNAISHNHVMLYPECDGVSPSIQSVVFEDCSTRAAKKLNFLNHVGSILKCNNKDVIEILKKDGFFRLAIPVDMLEPFLFELCDAFETIM